MYKSSWQPHCDGTTFISHLAMLFISLSEVGGATGRDWKTLRGAEIQNCFFRIDQHYGGLEIMLKWCLPQTSDSLTGCWNETLKLESVRGHTSNCSRPALTEGTTAKMLHSSNVILHIMRHQKRREIGRRFTCRTICGYSGQRNLNYKHSIRVFTLTSYVMYWRKKCALLLVWPQHKTQKTIHVVDWPKYCT